MKKENHTLQIVYIILLYLQVAFSLWCLWGVQTEKWKWAIFLFCPWVEILFFIIAVILGIGSVRESFWAYHNDDLEYCLKAMLKLKYGLVPFFVLNLIGMSALCCVVLMMCAIGGGNLTLVAVTAGVFGAYTWFMMLPGGAYAFQVARFAEREGKTTQGWLIVHMLLQCLVLVDVADTAYLAGKHWNRGKAGAFVIGPICVIAFIIWIAVLLTELL